jgi:hypothetical protein
VQDLQDALVYRGRFRAFPGALVGMKPPQFAEWMFRQLGAGPGDRLDDLFPGSGAVSEAWLRHVGPCESSFQSPTDASPVDGGHGSAGSPASQSEVMRFCGGVEGGASNSRSRLKSETGLSEVAGDGC